MIKNLYKSYIALTVFFGFLFATNAMQAQCMLVPMSLQNRVNNAVAIVEGKVIHAQCLWDEQARNIYTLYDIEVYTNYKGINVPNIVKLVDAGGTVGLQKDVVTNNLHLRIGNAGIFMLVPTNDPFSANLNYMEAYAGPQGFIAYHNANKKANCVFETYNNVDLELLSSIENFVGNSSILLKTLDWNKIVDARNEEQVEDNSNSNFQISQSNAIQSNSFSATSSNALIASGASITSFTPTSTNAGNNSVITINGAGFGATQGASTILFPNADDGGLSYISPLPSQYISWSNTQIQVVVPSPAGTGAFVITDGTNSVTSSAALTIGYHLTNFPYNIGAADSAYLSKHINANGIGGYTYQCNTGFASNAPALADFTNLTQAWRCTSGINWIIGANTSVNVIANDGVNIVRFDIGAELSANVLGVATSRYNGCITGSSVTFYVSEMDVVFDDATNWFYGNIGTPNFSQTDFYSVGVHELGHAHQLGHVIDPAKVMHYSISTGAQNRTLSPAELAGGNFTINNAASNPYCGNPLHKKYACIPKVVLTTSVNTINENATSLTVLATMNGVNDSAVTVNITTSGSASNGGADYNLPTTIIVPAGTNTASVTMLIVNDALYEGNENAIIGIISVINATEDGVQQQTVTIVDNELAPTVTLGNSVNNIAENGGATNISASIPAISGLPTIVNLTYTNGAGMTAAEYTTANSITIAAGNLSASTTLNSIDDAADESNETITVEIASLTNGTFTSAQPKIITVIDDEFVEFDLFQNTNVVPNNSTQSFGNIITGSTVSKIYKIKNTGNVPLTWLANIAGTNASKFGLNTTGSTATVQAGDSTEIIVEALPTCGDSAITAMLIFTNNDDDENPTTINLTALAIDEAPIPNIAFLPIVYGNCSASASAPIATDFCDGTIVAATLNATSYTMQGNYVITWIYTDSKLNTITQTQNIIVNDTTAPTPDLTSLPTITAVCDTTISINPTATDNCGTAITATTISNLNFSGAGSNTIVWNFTDANGNTVTQNQTVVVTNNKPTIFISNDYPNACQNQVVALFATATEGGTITWSNGELNGESFVVNTTSTFTVTSVSVNGCVNTATADINVAIENQIANATANNAASISGNICDTKIHIDGATIGYTNEACQLIAMITDASAGNVLSDVTTCVQIDATTPIHNGQPYVARYFDIVPTSQGAATIIFYFTQADFDNYNATASTLGFPTIVPNGLGDLVFSISQVPGGSLATAISATTIVHAATATWDAVASRWQTTIAVNSFSGFYAHSTNPNNAPLGILDIVLHGKITTAGQLLSWNVPQEKDVKYYNLLHSTDGIIYKEIQKQVARNTNQTEIYNYLHADYLLGNHYYKTMAMMQNGSTVTSNIVKLFTSNTASGIVAYPNPASNILYIQNTIASATTYQFVVVDAIGKTLKIVNAQLQMGTNTTEIDMQDIASGLYTLQVIANGKMMEVLKVEVVK